MLARYLGLILLASSSLACYDPAAPSGGTDDGTMSSSMSTTVATEDPSGDPTTMDPSGDPTTDPSGDSTTDVTTDATTDPATTDPSTSTTTDSSTMTTDPDSSSSSPEGSSSEGPGFCGDGVAAEEEICDDGVNAGQTEGDCAPDCSAVVQRKLIRLSQSSTQANFDPGNNAVGVADSFCPNGFLAFFTDGVDRVATVAPLAGNGQVDWVLQPWTEYVNSEDQRMWTTTELLLLGVADDNTWVGLENPLVPDVNFGFTGMLGDYTTSTLTCGGWSSTAGALASIGQAHETGQLFVGPASNQSGGFCSVSHEFICVEQ